MPFKYHTIGAKLILAFAASTLLLTIISLLAWGTWQYLDQKVSSLLKQSLPTYNASYELESNSTEIRTLVGEIANATSQAMLNQVRFTSQQQVAAVEAILAQLRTHTDLTSKPSHYQETWRAIEHFADQVAQRIAKQHQIDLLEEQLRWLHHDITTELNPMRQEVQWQLQTETDPKNIEPLMNQWNLIQGLLEDEAALYQLAQELIQASNGAQINNGMRLIELRLHELERLSLPLNTLPSAIAYQQLLEEVSALLSSQGEFHLALLAQSQLQSDITKQQAAINQSLNQLHSSIAQLVGHADAQFRQVKSETSQVITFGNHMLLTCFGLSILFSLAISYFFINRRLVRRLSKLSIALGAIAQNRIDAPVSVDGRDEIAHLSRQLEHLRQTMKEMERTNALNLINNTQASLITCDLDGHVESVNSSARQLLGTDIQGHRRKLWEGLPQSQAERLMAIFESNSPLKTSGNQSVTLQLGSDTVPLYLRFYTSLYQQGNSDKTMVTITDITEQAQANHILEQRVAEKTQSLMIANQELTKEIDVRREAEQHLKTTQSELIQAAKMAVVGQTMTSLAHELNQPLSAMSTYLYGAKLACQQGNPERIQHALLQVESLSERMSKLINNLRHFAKKRHQDPVIECFPLNQALDQAISLVHTKAKRQQTEIHNNIPHQVVICADAMGIEQVLVNLLVNAIDAVSQSDKRAIHVEFLLSAQSKVVLAISDSGDGFNEEVIDKLFTPFTTTKEVGLGLGLNICRSLIENNRGEIYLASGLNQGAMVVLEIPYE